MEIRPLTPELEADWVGFFEGPAFSDNPYWKSCYCTHFHRPERLPPEESQGRPTHRELARILIRGGIMRGYLAYQEGRVIGWCNVNRKGAYARFGAARDGEEGLLAVVCFVIDPAMRGQGIARALLERAIEEAPARGFTAIEAYPSERSKTASGNFRGPLSLFESLGFERLEGRKSVYRKTL